MKIILQLGFSKIFSRPANTLLGIILFSSGVTIISLLFSLRNSLEQFTLRNLGGIDMVLGAKGSPMQTILSVIFHLDYPVGNIPLEEALRIAKHPMIKTAVPVALGDNYQGFRIVGTTKDYPLLYNAKLNVGEWFDAVGEVTLGWEVASKTGLKPGDTFFGVHGLHSNGHAHHDFHYVVKGVMRKTHTVIDRLILTPVESVWEVHGLHHNGEFHGNSDYLPHEDDDHPHNHQFSTVMDLEVRNILEKMEKGEDLTEEEMQKYLQWRNHAKPESHSVSPDITAMLLVFSSPGAHSLLTGTVRQSTALQASVPVMEYNRLMKFLDPAVAVLKTIAWTIIVLSALFLFLYLLNLLQQSEFEIALLRVLGSSPLQVLWMLLWQGIIISFLGWITGMVISRMLWFTIPIFSMLNQRAIFSFFPDDFILLGIVLSAGLLASFFPAVMAYRLNIHNTLMRS